MKRSRIYQVLSLLLFAGLLASCSDVSQQEAVDEQSTFQTYAFNAEVADTSLSGELALELIGAWDTKWLSGSLSLSNGAQLSAGGSLDSEGVTITFYGDAQVIFGSGQLNSDGSLSGTFEDWLGGQYLEGGTWTATPTSPGSEPDDGQNPPNDPTPNPPSTPPGDSGSSVQGTLEVSVSASNAKGTVTLERITNSGTERVDNVRIAFESSGGTSTSSSSTTLPAGDYELNVNVEGDSSRNQTIPFTLGEGETETIDISL